MNTKVLINRLPTGVPGLDDILGMRGLPELSFNLIGGIPGSGKTTLAHQIMFSLAQPDRRAIFFTVLGEPALKMLRYQQQFSFFDINKVNQSIRFINLSNDLIDGSFDQILLRITEEVKAFTPSLIFVDSFRSIVQSAKSKASGMSDLQWFVQQLGMKMTSWQATTFLVGEYQLQEAESNPIYTLADGILWLTQSIYRNSVVRKIQVVKIRGQAQIEGLHTYRIGNNGIEIFPRTSVSEGYESALPATTCSLKNKRTPLGVTDLDEMLGGGLPCGSSILIVGPSGSGKTVLAMDFLEEGIRRGETGVVAAFEDSSRKFMNNKFHAFIESGRIRMINTRSLDMSIDETLHDLIQKINDMKAKRVVLDSLSGFELALAPEFREDFRGSLYRMIAELTKSDINILMTSEFDYAAVDLLLSPSGSAFHADVIIVQRYIEIASQYQRALSVIKVRGSAHSNDIRLYNITDQGIQIGDTLTPYREIMSGQPIKL
ncbi:ATPase domain-containing protein [Nitrosomonas supralitoralis]|uniref:non-specific serine/threonine protein kinase n=1 Tax=Nitrosomonas supralitoralis TaxID=2116706 RepID=A0A2P7NRP8_9PROT|nr:ATPase domain-containing protein [Nitrosomonas supralitoralis]PSJ16140.1 protein kinase [Nitrosomonas supralitoralis]